MSTVNKSIADQIISGKFSEDEVIAIIEYSNIFDGGLAYKLVYQGQNIDRVKASIACNGFRMYWKKSDSERKK